MGQVQTALPVETKLGLVADAHPEKGACDDIELIVSPASVTIKAITDVAIALKFFGKQPLSKAERRAAAEPRLTQEKATVILITDGIEVCTADPCALPPSWKP